MPGNTERIVELGFADGGQGSGFLLADRHIVTAGHLSADARRIGAACRIRRLPQLSQAGNVTAVLSGEVAWTHAGLDLSVIRLEQAAVIDAPAVVCGEVFDTRPIEVYFTGFPQAADRDSRTVSATLTHVPTGPRFDLDYHGASPSAEEQWGGMSGAMVFHDLAAVGVVRTVSRDWYRKFTATPLVLLLRDAGFRRYWAGEGQPDIAIVGAVPGIPAMRASWAGGERDMSRLLAWCDRTREFRTLRQLTAPAGTDGGARRLRLFGLAGHHDHRAVQIVPRLVDELRERQGNVIHVPLLRHPDFDSVDELRTEVLDSLFEGDNGAASNSQEMARRAIDEKWGACIVSCTFDCVAMGPKATRRRLAVAADWLGTLADFPCPVVVAIILRWGQQPKQGWIARLRGIPADPVWQVQQSWQEIERLYDAQGPADASALCVLDGYQREDLRRWIELKDVKASLHDCAARIAAEIDNWYGSRSTLSFAELHAILSKF